MVVVVFHRRWWIDFGRDWHGFLAVDFFYMLSGFVIAHAYERRIGTREMPIRRFLTIRAIRLYPLIWLGGFLGTLVLLLHASNPGDVEKALAAAPFGVLALPQPFLKNPFLPNEPVWSLFWELLVNVAFAIVAPRLSTRVLAIIIVGSGLCLLGAALMYPLFGVFGFRDGVVYVGAFRVTYPFALGILIYRLHNADILARIPKLPAWVLASGLTILLVFPLSYNRPLEVAFLFGVLAIAFPGIITLGSLREPSPRFEGLARFSGSISYPLYLLHWPVMNLLDLTPGFAGLPLAARAVFAGVGVILASLAAASLYDAPLRRWLSVRALA